MGEWCTTIMLCKLTSHKFNSVGIDPTRIDVSRVADAKQITMW